MGKLGNSYTKIKNIDIVDTIYDIFSNSNIEQELENNKTLFVFKNTEYVKKSTSKVILTTLVNC